MKFLLDQRVILVDEWAVMGAEFKWRRMEGLVCPGVGKVFLF